MLERENLINRSGVQLNATFLTKTDIGSKNEPFADDSVLF